MRRSRTPKMDLLGLVAKVNEHLKQGRFFPLTIINAREIIEYMKDITKGAFITIGYEGLSCLEQINKLNEEGGKFLPRFRIILSTQKYKARFDNPLVRECNGAVLEIVQDTEITCNLLAFPPREFDPRITTSSLRRFFNDFHVYPIKDGTTVNLYYDPHLPVVGEEITAGRWVRSTRNAFDIDNLKWRGYYYKDVLNEVLAKYPDFQPQKNLVYALGFKHPAYHPFRQPRAYDGSGSMLPEDGWLMHAWLIQVYDMETHSLLSPEKCADIGIPLQEPVSMDIEDILDRCDRSFGVYKESGEAELGYIFRSKDWKYADAILESDLWNAVRHLIYQLPSSERVNEKKEQQFKNMKYVILLNYLDKARRSDFQVLFPQYQSYVDLLDSLIADTVDQLCIALSRDSREGESDEPLVRYEDTPQGKHDRWVNLLTHRFLGVVSGHYSLQDNKEVDKSVIRDLINNNKFIDIYYNILDE